MSLGRTENTWDNVIYNGDKTRVVFYNMGLCPSAAGALAATDNPVWSVEGTNVDADADVVGATDGGWKLFAAGAPTADDENCLILNTAAYAQADNFVGTLAMKPAMTVRFTTGSSIAKYEVSAGIGSDDNADAPFDCGNAELGPEEWPTTAVAFGVTFNSDDDTNGYFRWAVKDSGTALGSQTEQDTGLTVEANTTYEFAAWVDSSRKPHMRLQKVGGNDVYYYDGQTAFATSTNVVGPFCGISFLTTTSKDLIVRDIKFAATPTY